MSHHASVTALASISPREFSRTLVELRALSTGLTRRDLRLCELALGPGAAGFASATLLTRVASPSTGAGWLAVADSSTIKIFREHVDAGELHARAHGLPLETLTPPTHEQSEEARELERRSLTMALANTTDESDRPDLTGAPDNDVTEARAQPEPGPRSMPAFDTWYGRIKLPAYGGICLRDRFRGKRPTWPKPSIDNAESESSLVLVLRARTLTGQSLNGASWIAARRAGKCGERGAARSR